MSFFCSEAAGFVNGQVLYVAGGPEGMIAVATPGDLADVVGQSVTADGWFTVDQARIDAFADTTDDHQWIHVDPERAAQGPFGATVAHGYLTLSLIPSLTDGLVEVGGTGLVRQLRAATRSASCSRSRRGRASGRRRR